jgi:hypothetical protein
MDVSPGMDFQPATSGLIKYIEQEVGRWSLAVRIAYAPGGTAHGALHFQGRADGTLLLAIETPEERMCR